MLHTCVRRFDVTGTVGKILATKQGHNHVKLYCKDAVPAICRCWLMGVSVPELCFVTLKKKRNSVLSGGTAAMIFEPRAHYTCRILFSDVMILEQEGGDPWCLTCASRQRAKLQCISTSWNSAYTMEDTLWLCLEECDVFHEFEGSTWG